jgi:hypothetical protein
MGSSPPWLAGPLAKLDHGRTHVDATIREARTFLDRRPFLVTDQIEMNQRVWRVHLNGSPPPSLALMAGDAVHNLRGALDHLAWQLVLRDGGSPNDRTGFPVRASERDVRRDVSVNLPGIKSTTRDAVLAAYRRERDLLWSLHRLDIIDKHRLLIVVGCAFRSITMRVRMDVPWQDEPVEAPPIALRPADRLFPLQGGEDVFRAPAREELSMHPPEFTFELAIAAADTPVDGEPLGETLAGLADAAERTIRSFIAES